jgi:thiol-disulfide isomerase/thioredoxin
MQFFNHYSAPIIGALIFIIVFSIVRRRGGKTRDWLILGGTMVIYVVAWLVLRPVAKPAMKVAGQPLLLEVQSPYCLGCVALKPAVDRLEKELQEKLVVRRVDIQSDEGRQLVEQYRVEFTPTFILFDAAGKERWRGTGGLDAATVRKLVDETR